MKKILLVAFAVVFPLFLGIAYYFFFSNDGGTTYGGGPCWIYSLTTLDCPGCGGQRAVYHMLHGNFMTALRFNVLFCLGLPIGLCYYYYFIRVYILKQDQYLDKFIFKSSIAWGVLISVIVFTILRNIPVFPFTYLNSHF